MKHRNAIGLLIIAGLLWSIAGVLIKSIPWPPLAIAGLRSGIAGVVILFYVKKPRFTWNKYQLLAAVAYAATVTLFVIANKLTTAGNAILLQYTAPVYVALLSFSFLRERSTMIDWLTIGVMLLGLVLFFLDELTFSGHLGNICGVTAGIFFGMFTILLRKQKDASPAESIILGNALTFLICLPVILNGFTADKQSVVLIFTLGVVQLGIPYILFAIAIKYVSALDAIIYPSIEPIINPLLVYLIIGETMGPYSLIGGLLVLGGVLVRAIIQKTNKLIKPTS